MSISEAALNLDSGIHGGQDILQPGRRPLPTDTSLLQLGYWRRGRVVPPPDIAQGHWRCCSKHHHSTAEQSGAVCEVGAGLCQQVAVAQ